MRHLIRDNAISSSFSHLPLDGMEQEECWAYDKTLNQTSGELQAKQPGVGPNPECGSCEGTGLVPCICNRWSDGDSGCSICRSTGRMTCPSCGGGGTAVPIAATLKVARCPSSAVHSSSVYFQYLYSSPSIVVAVAPPGNLLCTCLSSSPNGHRLRIKLHGH